MIYTVLQTPVLCVAMATLTVTFVPTAVYGVKPYHSSCCATTDKVASPTVLKGREAPPVIFVLGGPGSGKGTQCALLKQKYPVAQLCVGELLRNEAKSDTHIGRSVSDIMQRGEIVPGHVTMSLLRRELSLLSPTCKAVLIDGFPRAMDQAKQFETMVTTCKFVLFFQCDPAVMIARLRKRAVTSGRADDSENVFNRRLNTFHTQTMPVIDHYQARGLLRKIDGETGDSNEVFQRTAKLFDHLFSKSI